MSHKHRADEYLGIELWGKELRSYKCYVTDQQELASADDAPLDAIYKSPEYVWIRVANLFPGHPFIALYEQYMRLNPAQRAAQPFGDGR